jgi:hypothetical protein
MASFELDGTHIETPEATLHFDGYVVKVENHYGNRMTISLDEGGRVGYVKPDMAGAGDLTLDELLQLAIEDPEAFKQHDSVKPDESVRLFSTVEHPA